MHVCLYSITVSLKNISVFLSHGWHENCSCFFEIVLNVFESRGISSNPAGPSARLVHLRAHPEDLRIWAQVLCQRGWDHKVFSAAHA